MKIIDDDWRLGLAIIVLAVLSVYASVAFGAPPCKPLSADSQNYELELYPQNLILAGNAVDAFYVITHFCDRKYHWSAHYFVGYVRDLPGDFIARGRAALAANTAEFQAIWDSAIKIPGACDAGAPENVYTPICASMRTQIELTRPKPIVWQVRDNPNGTSRPVYPPNADGTRNTTALSGRRVSDVETNCACTARAIEETGGVYCDVTGQPNVSTADSADTLPESVALCVRQD